MNWFRLMLMVLGNMLILPFYIYKLLLFSRKGNQASLEEKYRLVRNIAIEASKKGRIKVNVSGKEHIPKKNGYLLCPNHQGYYDMLAIMEAQEAPFGIVVAKKYSGIILIREVIAALRGIAMDRKDIKASLEVIKEVTERLKQGYNFLIFPEGTRSKEGNKLLDMKAGAFKSAVMAKADILPVAIIDCYKPFDQKGIAKTEVSVHFLETISYEVYQDMKTTEIASLVKGRIQEYIDKNTQ